MIAINNNGDSMTVWQKLCENKDEIINSYRAGVSTCELGRRFQCNNGYIWTFLKQNSEPIRQTKVVAPNIGAVVALHHQGLSAYAINKKLGLKKNAAERALKKAGIDISHRQWRRDDPLVNHKDDIIARYLAGYGVHRIARVYDTRDASIIRFLRRQKITLRSLRDYAYPVNEHFFDLVDTETKAYVLGFLMADGCNMPQIPAISLSITDRDILEVIAAALDYQGPIHVIPPRKPNHKTQHQIVIGSRTMSDALCKLGCVRKKTYCATFPDESIVPKHLRRHTIRGWLDGDGTITSAIDRGRRHWMSRIVGTQQACLGISNVVLSTLGFHGCVCPVNKKCKHVTYGFSLSGALQLRRYLDWLYDDATIYLKRKHDKYLQFCRTV